MISRYWPHTPYAEDQPLAHTILTTHVLTRAVTTGTILGATIGTVRQLIPSQRQQDFPRRLLLSSSRGTLYFVGFSMLATGARMWGRDKIEWQDRSWRLLESKGQVETDDWTYLGMLAGPAAVAAMRGGYRGLGWRGVVGAAGLGSVGGMIGYMAWRYGVNGGKFPEKKEEAIAI